jgi:hypothetical protein
MVDEIQAVIQIVTTVLSLILAVGPIYYKIGKLSQKVDLLYKCTNIKARWKK